MTVVDIAKSTGRAKPHIQSVDRRVLNKLRRAIEQASFCALGYPTTKKSKSRSLTDHSVTSVPFTWNRVLLLAEFFLPIRQDLPEFDTVKPTSNAEQ